MPSKTSGISLIQCAWTFDFASLNYLVFKAFSYFECVKNESNWQSVQKSNECKYKMRKRWQYSRLGFSIETNQFDDKKIEILYSIETDFLWVRLHAMIKMSTEFGSRTILWESFEYSCIIGTSVDCLHSTVGIVEWHNNIWRIGLKPTHSRDLCQCIAGRKAHQCCQCVGNKGENTNAHFRLLRRSNSRNSDKSRWALSTHAHHVYHFHFAFKIERNVHFIPNV